MKRHEVLTTRLLIPPLRPELVARPQLMARLDQILVRRLALVSAPAGYGKTTLLAAWARHAGLPVAWLSLDEGDNDPARFAGYLCAALGTIPALAGDDLWEELQEFGLGQSSVPAALEAAQTALLNRMASAPGDFVLVLDDYHLVTEPAIHHFVATLLDHLPPQAHLAIASRADPSLPLPRLRARGQVVEIRLAELRFTTDEVAAFLGQAAGLHLDGPELAALASRTEGWAAGLQMAALSMQGRTDPASFVRDFAGSNRFILDYLVEEVLDRQPAAIQDFLLATSILERMSAELAQALLAPEAGGPSGQAALDVRTCQETLETLEQNNLFVIPLDDRREWYRYHHLFADLLSKRLHQERPDQAPVLRGRASRWLEQHGMLAGAIEQALLAGEAERAAELVERAAEEALMAGEVSTVLGWMRRLPGGDFFDARPRLDLYAVTALVLLAEDQAAIEAGLVRLGRRPGLEFEIGALRAYLALMASRVTTAEQLARRALATAPEGTTFFRSIATWTLNTTEAAEGTLGQRIEALEGAVEMARSQGNRMVWASALCALANVRVRQGRLAQASDIYKEAVQVATGPDGRLLPIAGEALIGLGHLLREGNELDEAVRCLEEGIGLIRQVRWLGAVEGQIALALCRQAQGQADAALEMVAEARRTASYSDSAELDNRLIDFYEAVLLHKQGDAGAILRYFAAGPAWKRSPDVDELDLTRIEAHLQKYERVAWARACVANGREAEALAALDELLPPIKREGRLLMVAEIELLRSLALFGLGRPVEGQATFEAALDAGGRCGLVRMFLDEGAAVVAPLRKAARGGAQAAYAARLLDALSAGAGPAPAEPAPAQPAKPMLAEPLSPRELEVLGLLAGSLSAREIAQQLCVAESTVNSHAKSIYGKLGVRRRLEAVEVARDLGLL